MKKFRVLHRIPTFELDVQIMTPLRWPGKCARGVGGDFLGGPWGLILPVKNNEKPNVCVFNLNTKSNKKCLRFGFMFMVEGRRT